MHAKSSLAVFATILPLLVNSQEFDRMETVALQGVTVVSTRLGEFAIGAAIERPDSLLVQSMKTNSLSDLLSISSGASIRSYGLGGLSTISIRGGGSAHVAVTWNGFNIQSPMNSGVNLSVMPVAFFRDVQVQHGGSGTLFGSGAMSGVVHLTGQNLFNEPDGVELVVGAGSFSNYNALLKAKGGNDKFAAYISAFAKVADNDFEFKNTARIGSPIDRQTNAGLSARGLMFDTNSLLTDRIMITTGFWYQHNDKDLQTQMTNRRPNNQNQTDDNILGSLNFRFFGPGYTLSVRQGVIFNQIDFTNPDVLPGSSISRSLSLVSEAESRFTVNGKHVLNVGLNFTSDQAQADGYRGKAGRDRFAYFSFFHMKHFNNRLSTVLSARNEISSGTASPVVFSIGNNAGLSRWFTFKSSLSRNYRIPSLNDLYWVADTYARGNPQLVPESGWAGEGGIYYNKGTTGSTVELSATTFFTRVNNWIVWLPENGIWTPRNKKTGFSRGLEARARYSAILSEARLNANISYYYTFSRLRTGDEYDGGQMIYVPRHKAMLLVTGSTKNLSGGVVINFTGERYHDYRNTIEPYLVGDLFATWQVKPGNPGLKLNLRVNNIWDASYQVMAFYAMPRRNFSASINLKF